MAKHLADKDIAKIVGLIDGWSDAIKFTWQKMCEQAESSLSIKTTRQTLQGHKRIKDAYKQKKEALKNGDQEVVKTPASLRIAADRIAKLEAENARLKREQAELLAQFLTWEYNAYANRVTGAQLNKPLPEKVKN